MKFMEYDKIVNTVRYSTILMLYRDIGPYHHHHHHHHHD